MRLSRRTALASGAVALVLASGLGVGGRYWSRAQAGSGGAHGGSVFATLLDPASIFAERSPGGRGLGALLQTKPGRDKTDQGLPHERALALVREPPGGTGLAPGGGTATPPAFDGYAPGGSPASTAPILGGDVPAGSPASGGPGTDGPSLGAPTENGGVPLASSYPVVTTPSGPGGPVVSAIPEPAGWVMMIGGMFAVGGAVRRRRARPGPMLKARRRLDA